MTKTKALVFFFAFATVSCGMTEDFPETSSEAFDSESVRPELSVACRPGGHDGGHQGDQRRVGFHVGRVCNPACCNVVSSPQFASTSTREFVTMQPLRAPSKSLILSALFHSHVTPLIPGVMSLSQA
ncbi:hypothetical protein RRG08_053596 [Elysia crispata]|uniref:Secreted protein n=1 Tax=Elysia crispata TaxID=231223 RepID=A0AAE0Y1I7_9GAST|nr:hypothetical protein RRG08_053596 [Elysia crispata]